MRRFQVRRMPKITMQLRTFLAQKINLVYANYSGCSSEKAASSSNYHVFVDSMCDVLEIKLNEIPDWNCCSASISYAGTLLQHINVGSLWRGSKSGCAGWVDYSGQAA